MRLWLTVGVLLALVACGSGDVKTPGAWERSYESGTSKLTVRVDRDRIDVAGQVAVELEAVVDEGVAVEFPAIGDKIGEFSVVRTITSEPQLVEGNRIRLSETHQLEPFLPGEYEIPELEVRFGADGVLKTEPAKVEVTSVLPQEEAEEPPDIKEIVPPVSLPGFSPWVYAAAGLALAALAFFIWWRRRSATEDIPLPPQPHEIALRALRELMAEKLVEKGEAKLFYLRVSAILRHYIEGRFGLHAPESTTEEFLNDLRRDHSFTERQKELLKNFLVHCDMVKFARYGPTPKEIDDTINTCAQFIAETKPAETKQAEDAANTATPVPATAGGNR